MEPLSTSSPSLLLTLFSNSCRGLACPTSTRRAGSSIPHAILHTEFGVSEPDYLSLSASYPHGAMDNRRIGYSWRLWTNQRIAFERRCSVLKISSSLPGPQSSFLWTRASSREAHAEFDPPTQLPRCPLSRTTHATLLRVLHSHHTHRYASTTSNYNLPPVSPKRTTISAYASHSPLSLQTGAVPLVLTGMDHDIVNLALPPSRALSPIGRVYGPTGYARDG